jgi:endonuclease/exonuclease/phosphatase family metal-dependent hydrolase
VGKVRPQTPSSLGVLAAMTLMGSIVLLDQTGTVFLICIGLVQFIFGWWLSRISMAGKTSNIKYHIRTSSFLGLGQFLFVLVLLLIFGNLIFRVDLPNNSVISVLALILGSAVFLAQKISNNANIEPSKDTSLILVMLMIFMAAPIHWAFQTSDDSIDVTATLPVSVMTYNIHSAVSNIRGQDLESIAQVIESSGTDIVAIQEISRGWLMSGGIDIVSWLSDRLEMEAVFSGTANKLWGVAILSKYPIVESGSGPLPQLDSFIPRGFIWVKVDIGAQQPLFIINTHLHHISDEQDVRLAQVPILLDLWDNAATTILLGDMNALPGAEEMDMIANTGFADSWAESGVGDEYTLPAHNPTVRVDWIWHTKDLISLKTQVLSTTASDHLPVVAIITQAEQ